MMESLEVCQRRILSQKDIDFWLHSQGYDDYINFIKQLNEFSKGFHNDPVLNKTLLKIFDLLERLSKLVDETPPIINDGKQRFGNKAYRDWFDQMLSYSKTQCLSIFGETKGTELFVYLRDSFGNRTRIDYGTGHEMAFVIFLMGTYKLSLIPQISNDDLSNIFSREAFKELSVQILSIFVNYYLPLIRKIQTTYRLEPAGSHGVFSLDDFQFLPFYFGSSQLIGSDLTPNSFPSRDIAEKHSKDYMFYGAVAYIHQVKSGSFAEHSNQLWNISAVPEWSKINNGLLKMYLNEYLPKFQIVQHLYFGDNNRFLSCETLKLINEIVFKFRYDIIYSTSYQVPVIYFRVENTSGASVDLEWIWSHIPKLYLENQSSPNLYDSYGKIVTQIMHPIDGLPCFFIHPCNTAKLMSKIISNPHKRLFYVPSWLSSISPVIGYEFSFQNYS